MNYETSATSVIVFAAFVGVTLGLSFYLGRRAKSSEGYFAAHGQIPWFVNGIAFAGDYLSAASFLGICGMIAFYGYDGFLYSIGYLAGWIVALFVVAEPLKRLGKYTFADALDAKFKSRGIKLAVGISTLAVSLFYLIPQMVGAGVLVQPLFGLPHWAGVVLVGAVVIVIVVTAGMVSTTWVQFLKGSLLVLFSVILTVMILARGFEVKQGGNDGHQFARIGPLKHDTLAADVAGLSLLDGAELIPAEGPWKSEAKPELVRLKTGDKVSVWSVQPAEEEGEVYLLETQVIEEPKPDPQTTSGESSLVGYFTGLFSGDGGTPQIINGEPSVVDGKPVEKNLLHEVGYVSRLPDGQQATGELGPISFLSTLQQSEVVLWGSRTVEEPEGSKFVIYYQKPTPGRQVLRPGEHPTFQGIRSTKFTDKLNFLSLMLALFCGTASLPHILIRYYTVKDGASARKSTIVGIASIGFFYVLTLYMGLGAMTSGSLDVSNSNMAAPLLARSMNSLLFAAICAIAFTTVLGTVSGLILASAGAVTHDLLANTLGLKLNDQEQVRVAKIASVVVGAVAIVLGIVFEKLNVSYLVGWAFSVAASANLPALVMLLFWKRTTKQGIIAAVIVGMTSSLAWILLSADTFTSVYGLKKEDALVPFSQPGIVTIPLGFLTLIVVSLLTSKSEETAPSSGD